MLTILRHGVVAILALALLVIACGCGVGPATDKEKISRTATTHLRALADGDTAAACAQLTRDARGAECEAALGRRLERLRPEALRRAADGSMDIEVDGDAATATLAEPAGARLELMRVGADWRIDSGYTLG